MRLRVRGTRPTLLLSPRRPHQRRALCALAAAAVLCVSAPAAAQHEGHQLPPVQEGWTVTTDAATFFGYNYQYRKFFDFSAWESQNWLMADAGRRVGRGVLHVNSMVSLEPFTLHDIGSPQVFQTGETFRGAALVDYQHPHDLIMGLGTEYRRPLTRLTLIGGADLVGSPTLGPTVFMHRASAADNPQAPLSHHYLDSTHVTPGVLRTGVEAGPWRAEGSWFRGREPDQNRTDIDLGALDSYAARISWNRGPWSAQVSGALLTLPEAITPYDAKKLTASIGHTGTGDRRLAWLAAFGQKREIHGNLEAYLFEAHIRATSSDAFYTRAESVAKDILDAGFHPRGTFHRHRQSQVGALTLGYVRDVLHTRGGTFGIGADVTGYLVPDNLKDSYGHPASFHVFVRHRLRDADAPSAHE